MSSVVRKCINKFNNQCYAVKILDLQKFTNPQDLESIQMSINAEVKALQLLNSHANISKL